MPIDIFYWHFCLIYSNTNFLINIAPLAKSIIDPPIVATYSIGNPAPVFTLNITGASSISSSPGFLLFGVESISGVLLSFLSLLISATFTFNPKLSFELIHVSNTSTSADSPGFNNVSFSWSVTIFPSTSFQFGLSAATNFNPSGI